ncbi:MAG: hypothetical protein GX207_07670 [Peptococcaceae bacterium]|nr:hypothetical protein [Peptococcaceae bacterium]
MGPTLSLPVGFAIFTIICVIIQMIISEVAWVKWMTHLPEDKESWSDTNRFVIDYDD